jgi:hypothetical protein
VPSPVLETTHAAPLDVATIVALLVFAVVSFAPLASFVRGGAGPQRPAPPDAAAAETGRADAGSERRAASGAGDDPVSPEKHG